MLRLLAIVAATAAAEPGAPSIRRGAVARKLSKRFGDAIGKELLSSFDAGKFAPMFAEDDGVDDQYVVTWHKNCALPHWIEQEGHRHLSHLQQTVITKEVGTSGLLTALRDTSGCVKEVTQDFLFRLPESERVTVASSKRLAGRRLDDPGLPWGIDFLDGSFSGEYNPPYDGTGVRAYIVDTGVDDTHPWLPNVLPGFDALGEDITQDLNGHGTHCAGTVAGMYVGVARGAAIVPVRVLGPEGSGSMAGIVAGLDWIAGEKAANPLVPMLASMSLGGIINQPSNEGADSLVAAGVTVIVAAGNSFIPGAFFSPCSASLVLCVGALANPAYPETGTSFAAASYSNWGGTVKIWAPGSAVTSARSSQMLSPPDEPGIDWTISGTSMACPHVAGIAAQLLQSDPTMSPAQIVETLTTSCSVDFGDGTLKNSPSAVARTKNAAATDGPCAGGFAVDVTGDIPIQNNPIYLSVAGGLALLGAMVACILAFFVPKRKTPSRVEQQKQASATPKFVMDSSGKQVNLSEYYIPEGLNLPVFTQPQA